MNHVVYWIRKKDQNDIKTQGYIGVTNNFKTRAQSHKSEAKKGTHRNSYLQRVIQKYNDDLVYEVIFKGPMVGCYQIEAYFRPAEKIGWNLAIGGEIPAYGRVVSKETRKKLSKAHKGKNIGHLYTEEANKKRSKSMAGKANHQAKQIICVETGEIFDTVTAAAKKFSTFSQAISRILMSKRKTTKGYSFKYYNKGTK